MGRRSTPRQSSFFVFAACVLALATAQSVAAPESLGAAHPGRRYFLLVEPRLEVMLTIAGAHILRAGVSAPASCTDGPASQDVGFGIVGGPGLPLRGAQDRFRKETQGSTRKSIFRGRVEATRVVGVFFESYREEPTGERGLPEEPLGPRCGNGSPHGELVHFVADEVPEGKIPPGLR